MSSQLGKFASEIYQGTGLGSLVKGWNHASKIFVSGNYRLAPKMGFLFHVAFDINPNITRLATTDILEAGLLVKSMQLPKYTVDNKVMNMYNRPNIVQNKVKYDPVNITFHDDNSDIIRDLWYDYYSYYYRDSDYTPANYLQATKYNTRTQQQWGYTPSTYTQNSTGADRLLQRVRMYSLHQKRFTEYVLINPTITAFQHGEHQNSNDAAPMQHTMTLAYESVLYNYGTLNSGKDIDFAELHYDNSPSPLGLPSLAGSLINSLTGGLGDGMLGSVIGAATGVASPTGDKQLSGGRVAFATDQGPSGLSALLTQVVAGVAKGNNPLKNINVPTIAGYAKTLGSNGGIGSLFGLGSSTYLQGTALGGKPVTAPVGGFAAESNGLSVGSALPSSTGFGSIAGTASSIVEGGIGSAVDSAKSLAGSVTGSLPSVNEAATALTSPLGVNPNNPFSF